MKKPSVSVRRGVISQPSSEVSAALLNIYARPPRAFATSADFDTDYAGPPPVKFRISAPFSWASTEQVM